MKRYHNYFLLLLHLFLLQLFIRQGLVLAAQSDLDRVNDNIEAMERQKETEERQMEELRKNEEILTGELKDINEELIIAAAELTRIGNDLDQTAKKVHAIHQDLDAARVMEEKQLESMKIRMRFLYENGDKFPLALILEADSFTDAINKGEYFSKIWDYDRKMLLEYQKTRENISWKEQMLKQEQSQQTALKREQEKNKISAEKAITDIRTELAGTDFAINQSQAEVLVFDQLLQEQKEYEKELEAQKAIEEEKQLQYINSLKQFQTDSLQNGAVYHAAGDSSMIAYPHTQNDIELLGAIIECEAGGESYEGKLAVGSVVMNRIRSPHFPNSLLEVIYQRGQFTPVGSGRFAVVLARGASAPCLQAAAEVLGGKITLDHLFFRTNNGSKSGIVIGNHVFY